MEPQVQTLGGGSTQSSGIATFKREAATTAHFQHVGVGSSGGAGTATIESIDTSNNPPTITISVSGPGISKSVVGGVNQISLQPTASGSSGEATSYQLTFAIAESLQQAQWQFAKPASAAIYVNEVPAGFLAAAQDSSSLVLDLYDGLTVASGDARYKVSLGLQQGSSPPIWIDDPTLILKPPS
jgi:hypothetical protein